MVQAVLERESVESRGDTLPNNIRLYLDEIAHSTLLTASQEVELGRSIQLGLEAEEVLREHAADSATRAELERRAAGGQAARRRLISSNLRLVVSVARRYQNRGLTLEDLIQEGNLGLFRAAEKYDPERGFRFSTYATWWIRQALSRAIADQSRLVRLPVHVNEAVVKLREHEIALQQQLGREPTAQELAATTGLPSDRVTEILTAAREPISLETEIGEDGDTIGDLVPDERYPGVPVIAERNERRDLLADALDTLLPRERAVLRLRYGLADGEPHTLAEVGAELGVSRERVRQLEMDGLRRLRQQVPDLAGLR